MKEKNYQIQSLRGILCIFVMVYHFTCRYSQLYNQPEFYNIITNILGNIGLSCFLIISGYHFINPNKIIKAKEFIKNKIFRLYPEYLIAIIIIFLVEQTGYIGIDRKANLMQLFLNIPMLNVFCRVGYIDGAHWYITFLLLMTFVYALAIKLKLYEKKSFFFMNFIMISLYCIVKSATNISVLSSNQHYVKFYLMFYSGILLRVLKEKKVKWSYILIILNSGLLFFFYDIINIVLILFMCLIINYSLDKKITLLEKIKGLTIIGDNSYFIYLIHQNIGYSIINFLNEFKIPMPVIIIISCGFIVTLSYIAKKIKGEYMKNFLKYIKNAIKFTINNIKIIILKLKGASIGNNVVLRK